MSFAQNFSTKITLFGVSLAVLLALGFLFFARNNAYAQSENITTQTGSTAAEDTQTATSAQDLDDKIKQAERLVADLSEKIEAARPDNPGLAEARQLLSTARNRVNEVHPALAGGGAAQALAKANESVDAALEGINKIEGDTEAEQLAAQDENVTSQDLGVGDPTILPGNPFYAFKGAFRTVQTWATRNPLKKAELKIRFANEKIIEAKKLEEGGASDNRVKNAVANYQEEVSRAKIEIEKLDGLNKTAVEAIVKKTADSQIKHYKILGRLMKKRENIAPEIEKEKQVAMQGFSESMASVVEPEVLRQKFEEAMQEQKGSAFKRFQNIEMLEEVKDFVPEQAQKAIQNAIEQSSKLFKEEFRGAEENQRKIFNRYMEKIGGNEVRHLEAFDAINTFADIEKDMMDEMEKAREKARKRIEHRMKSIKDESRKEIFIAHLKDAKMEDVRIVKELENNLDPETVTTILDIKHKVDQKMREKFENAESVGDLDSFFNEIENAPDVRMMEVLQEMEGVIPEDKKEFWEEMKKKAMSEMRNDIERARRFGRFDEKMRQLAGVDPEQLGVIDSLQKEFNGQFDFFDEMRQQNAEAVNDRFSNINEFAKFRPDDIDLLKRGEHFKLRIQEDPSTQARLEQFDPRLRRQFREFDRRRENADFSSENLDEAIQRAESTVRDLTEQLATSQNSPEFSRINRMLAQAKDRIDQIHSALAQGKQGEAFGLATSADQLGHDGIQLLKKTTFNEEREKYFEERDDFRKKFKELPPEERPDPNDFIDFRSISFPEFNRIRDNKKEHGIDDRESRRHGDNRADRICGSALTPARHTLSGQCVTFPNTCLPDGWIADQACASNTDFKPIHSPDFDEKDGKREFQPPFFNNDDNRNENEEGRGNHDDGRATGKNNDESDERENFFNFPNVDFPSPGEAIPAPREIPFRKKPEALRRERLNEKKVTEQRLKNKDERLLERRERQEATFTPSVEESAPVPVPDVKIPEPSLTPKLEIPSTFEIPTIPDFPLDKNAIPSL